MQYGSYQNLSTYLNLDGPKDAYSMGNKDHIRDIWENITYSLKDDVKRMVRAFPTFKLYFVEVGEEAWSKYDNVYGYNSIESIQVHKSKENAADTAVVSMTNFFGNLDNVRFTDKDHQRSVEDNSDYPVPFKKMFLYPGTRIQIKIGYSSDENELENVFTGKITEVEFGDRITFVAQGYGVELLHDKGWDWTNSKRVKGKADPLNIMNELVRSSEVKDLGRYSWYNIESGEILGNRVSGWWVPFLDFPQDDNIFLDIKSTQENFEIASWDKLRRWKKFTSSFRLYHTTAWDVFKEFERRFPGYVTAVVPYDERGTLFFGLPNQKYNFTRGRKDKDVQAYEKMLDEDWEEMDGERNAILYYMDLRSHGVFSSIAYRIKNGTLTEMNAAEAINILKNKSELATDPLKGGPNVDPSVVSSTFIDALDSSPSSVKDNFEVKIGTNEFGYYVRVIPNNFYTTNMIRNNRMIKSDEFNRELPSTSKKDPKYKTFRSYHFKDSISHIITNNIKINLDNFYNKVVVWYFKDKEEKNEKELERMASEKKSYTLKADDSIDEEYTRTKVLFEQNAVDGLSAKRYALGNLLKVTQELYDGEIVILGDASVKPYDYVYINDMYNNMYGPIEVKEVVHDFSMETGFITTIVPHLVVNANNPFAFFDTVFGKSVRFGMAAAAIAAHGIQMTTGAFLGSRDTPVDLGRTMWRSILGSPAAPSRNGSIFPVLLAAIGENAGSREPISIHPLMYADEPYIAGFEGMVSDSWWELKGKRFAKSAKEVFASGSEIAKGISRGAGLISGLSEDAR